MRIMYVEDNQVNLGLVVRIAKMGNHEVINFPNGSDALKALETESVDLILMDIELEGELDGIEVVKRLRARGDKRPIVAITAYAMVGDKERILEAGCDDYLPKPLPVAQFLNILSKYDPANDGVTKKDKAPEAAPSPKVESKPKARPPKAQTAEPTPEVKSGSETKPEAKPEPAKEAKPAAEAKPETTATATEQIVDTPVQPSEKPEAEAKEAVVKPTEATTADEPEKKDEKQSSEVTAKPPVENAEAPTPQPKAEEKPKDPERDPEATVPFDPDELQAEIKADREAKGEKPGDQQSAELQTERESHDKPDKI